jgi:hypothetical protein
MPFPEIQHVRAERVPRFVVVLVLKPAKNDGEVSGSVMLRQ